MNTFNKQFRGYDVKQVDFEMQMLQEKNKALQETISNLEKQLTHETEQNELLNHRVEIIEKTNEEIARLALKEASDLIDKAKRNADMILKESLEYVRNLSGEMEDFKEQAVKFRASVQQMSKDIIDSIDGSEVFQLIQEDKEI